MSNPVGVFEVSVDDIAALVPEASIPDTRSTGQKAVIASEVEDWILSLTAALEAGLGDAWNSLPSDRLTQVSAAAKTVVACGVASYLEAARAPERAGLADTSYAGVLWERWTTGRAELVTQVHAWLAENPPETPARLRPAYSFPVPSITDDMRW